MENQPLISIIMGVHNLSPRWKMAIKSLINQTYPNWECIICDDGSTDDSFERLKNYTRSNDKFHIIRNNRNLGLASALNNCVRHSKGELIARMDDDDICEPNRLAEEVQFLKDNKDFGFVSSCYYVDDGATLTKRDMIEKPSVRDFLWTSPFLHPATMFRKSSLSIVGGYTEGKLTSRAEDYDLYMKLYSKHCYGYNIQQPLYRYYVGESELRKKLKYRYRIYESIIRFKGFRALRIPAYTFIPFIIKPLMVGLIPKSLIYRIRTSNKYDKKTR